MLIWKRLVFSSLGKVKAHGQLFLVFTILIATLVKGWTATQMHYYFALMCIVLPEVSGVVFSDTTKGF
jgi:hypothetical protein